MPVLPVLIGVAVAALLLCLYFHIYASVVRLYVESFSNVEERIRLPWGLKSQSVVNWFAL